MTHSAVVYTASADSEVAAQELSEQIRSKLTQGRPDVIILFASPRYRFEALLEGLQKRCEPRLLIGASSAGEFTSETQGEGLACALALQSDEMEFSVGIGRHLSQDRMAAARAIVRTFKGTGDHAYPHRSALVMTDALAGHADDLVDELTLATAGRYQFFGGGAGDNAQFRRTHVFFGTEAVNDAAVGLEILSKKPIGIGVGHGWEPTYPALRVTESNGMTLIGLNGMPAADAIEGRALASGQSFDRAAPLPFFLHNVLGIDTGHGYRLRVPLAVNTDGSITCAAEIPTGSKVHLMRTTSNSAVEAAARATSAAVAGLGGHKPNVALFFDCVATRLRMGDEFGLELQKMAELLGPGTTYAGCNTHGQIARADGQFGGFHNCTAVVCVLPS